MLEQVQQVDTRNISQNARKTEREREREELLGQIEAWMLPEL